MEQKDQDGESRQHMPVSGRGRNEKGDGRVEENEAQEKVAEGEGVAEAEQGREGLSGMDVEAEKEGEMKEVEDEEAEDGDVEDGDVEDGDVEDEEVDDEEVEDEEAEDGDVEDEEVEDEEVEEEEAEDEDEDEEEEQEEQEEEEEDRGVKEERKSSTNTQEAENGQDAEQEKSGYTNTNASASATTSTGQENAQSAQKESTEPDQTPTAQQQQQQQQQQDQKTTAKSGKKTKKPVTRKSANSKVKGPFPSIDIADALSTRGPGKAVQLNRAMKANRALRTTIKEQEAHGASQQATINKLRDEMAGLRVRVSKTQPRLVKLEAQLATMQVEYDGMKEREANAHDSAIRQGRARVDVTRETDVLRRRIESLTGDLAASAETTEQLQAANARMKDGFGDFIEVKLRNKVLETENERLRTDLVIGMDQLRGLLQAQMEIGWELNELDLDARHEVDRKRREALEAAGQSEDGAETLAHLGMRFRGSSIWERELESGMAGRMPSYSAVPSRTIVWSPRGGAHVGTQVTSPASLSDSGRSPFVEIAGMRGSEMKKQKQKQKQKQRQRQTTGSPLMNPPVEMVTRGTETDPPPRSEVVRTIAHGTQTSPCEPQSPSSPLKHLPETALPPGSAEGSAASTTQSSGTQTRPDQHWTFPEQHSRRSSCVAFIPTLLMLLSAFFLALYADRLAAERDVWARANGAVRGLTTGWNGSERWSHSAGEWIFWKTEVWKRVERATIG